MTTTEATTAATTEATTAATTEKTTEATTASTETTNQPAGADNPVEATKYMASLYGSGKFTDTVAATQDEYFNVMFANLKRRINQSVLDEEGITDARALETWLVTYLDQNLVPYIDAYGYNIEITGAEKEVTLDEAYKEFETTSAYSDSTVDHVYEYLGGAEKLYIVPIKISVSYEGQSQSIEGHDVVCIYQGKAYSCLGIETFGPAVVKYLDKVAVSKDVSTAWVIRTGVEMSLANEEAYNEVANAIKNAQNNGFILTGNDKDGNSKQYYVVATVQDNVAIEMQNGLSDDGAFCKELKLNIPSSKTCVLTYGSDRYIIAISDDCSEVAIFAGSGGDASIFEILPMADSVYK